MYFFSSPPEIGSEHGKSVFLLLSKIKAVPSLEAQKDMVKWVLQVGYSTFLIISNTFQFLSFLSSDAFIFRLPSAVYIHVFLLDV